MRAVEIRAFGSPDGMALGDVPAPLPAEGELLVTVEAAGVSGADALIRSGALAAYGFTAGFVPGNEVAGTVAEVGPGVDTSWVGRKVWAFTGVGGGYVEQAVASVDQVLPLPHGLSAVDAVTVGASGAVAHFALAHARLTAGQSVLVRGAAGGIGVMGVQLAVQAGALAVTVTTSSAERGERLRQLGATHVLDRSGAGNSDTPDGYDVIFDMVGGVDLPSFLERLKPNGRFVAVGAVAGQPPADFGTTLMARFQESLSFATFSAATVDTTDLQLVRRNQFRSVVRGELAAVVHEVLPLDQAVLAHQKMEAGEVFGRIALTP